MVKIGHLDSLTTLLLDLYNEIWVFDSSDKHFKGITLFYFFYFSRSVAIETQNVFHQRALTRSTQLTFT